MHRAIRIVLLALAVLTGVTIVALGTSAAIERPARIVVLSGSVEASKQEAWAVLTDFDAYDEWNPFIRQASGEARVGTRLRLEAVLPGHDPESLDAKVLVARPERKLRWQDRLYLPGLRDWEYEFVLLPVEPGRVLVVQQLHVEGLLAPFADTGAMQEALQDAVEALRVRLAATR